MPAVSFELLGVPLNS